MDSGQPFLQPRQLSPPLPYQIQQRQFVLPDNNLAFDSQEVPANYAFTQNDESNNSDLNDEFILTALQNPRDRITLLKLEQELERFINSNETRLGFPPMSSYQRLIVHRVAQYFNLGHTAIDIYPQQRTVVLVKTPETKMPPVLFREMNVNKEQETTQQTRSAPPKAIKIMQRQPARDESTTSTAASGSKEALGIVDTKTPEKKEDDKTRTTPKTLEEREQEYAKARARIFSSNELKTEANNQQQSTESSVTTSSETNEERDTLQRSPVSKNPHNQQQPQPLPVQSVMQPYMKQPTKPKVKQNKENNSNGVDGDFESSRNGWAENANPRSNTKPFWSSNADNDYNDYNDFYSYDIAPVYVNPGYAYPPRVPQGDNQDIWPYPEPLYPKTAPPQPPLFAQPFPRKNQPFPLGPNNYPPNNVHNYDQIPPQPPLGHPTKGGGSSRQWNNYSRDERVISRGQEFHGKPNMRSVPDVVQYVPQQMGHVSPPPPPSMPNYPAYDQAYPQPTPPQPYNNDPAWFPPLYNPGYPHRGGPIPSQPQQPRQAPMMNNPYSYPSYSQATQYPTGPPSGGAPISYDYERRPPKSTELFDPNAPGEVVTKKMSQMSISSDRGGGGGRGRGGRGGGQYYNPNPNPNNNNNNAWSSPQPRDRYHA